MTQSKKDKPKMISLFQNTFTPNESVRNNRSPESERKFKSARELHQKRMADLKRVTEQLKMHNAKLAQKK